MLKETIGSGSIVIVVKEDASRPASFPSSFTAVIATKGVATRLIAIRTCSLSGIFDSGGLVGPRRMNTYLS